ncbi:MAG: hypothetical protein HC866_09900 [Leptolyngbyaceae cyanobacterium RU_5_1]|nr:hypothetical protein [Leptolyngbyaceae cyanobacterium RU_5_1]
MLENRDYTVIVAKTAASTTMTPPGFADRWVAAHDAVIALAQKCEEFDPDGITIYMSSNDRPDGSFKHYERVTSGQLESIFVDNFPPDTLNLLNGLQVALDSYFARKAANQTKPNGEIIIVLVDGEPSDRMKIAKTIVQAANHIDSDQELGIGFAQVGEDLIARGFLTALDQDLRSQAGAKFDIVHTRLLEDIYPEALTDFLRDILQG